MCTRYCIDVFLGFAVGGTDPGPAWVAGRFFRRSALWHFSPGHNGGETFVAFSLIYFSLVQFSLVYNGGETLV